ncbi:MAG TPA: hypothetical protein VMT64_05815, partial [Candidatus Binataceae bacterium]|nr:hypothetical protein [Candidatus Binataceae bacterium]
AINATAFPFFASSLSNIHTLQTRNKRAQSGVDAASLLARRHPLSAAARCSRRAWEFFNGDQIPESLRASRGTIIEWSAMTTGD